ncbi:MAG: hypothetical protein IKU17_05685 [Clostridia bacterium]|nr:hypothetical protein [Clostridia bacterium]
MKKIVALLITLLLLVSVTGCDGFGLHRLTMYQDQMMQNVMITKDGIVYEVDPVRCEELATLLLKDLDMDGSGENAECDYSAYTSVEIVLKAHTYRFYVHTEGNVVRVEVGMESIPLEVYDTKIAEKIMNEIDSLIK